MLYVYLMINLLFTHNDAAVTGIQNLGRSYVPIKYIVSYQYTYRVRS